MQSSLSIGAGCPKSFTGLCPDVSQPGQASRSAAQHPWLGRDPDKNLVAPAEIMLSNAKSPGDPVMQQGHTERMACQTQVFEAVRRARRSPVVILCSFSSRIPQMEAALERRRPFLPVRRPLPVAPPCPPVFAPTGCFSPFLEGVHQSDDFHLICCSKRPLLLKW
jgi:hypothetical protein